MSDPNIDERPVMSMIWDTVQKYREASGCDGKYLRGHPSLEVVGQLAATEFGLEWVSDATMPPGTMMVGGDA
jgi:hypothetical protein